jgi:C4-dicarboxylate-specific signal transduction histidine kinase
MSNLESVTEGLQDASGQVPNLTSIVNRFRNLAKCPSDKPATQVDLSEVAERVAKLFNGSRQQMTIELRLDEKYSLPPVVMNERDLEQLFYTFYENAFQAADGKKNQRLIVNAITSNQHIELCFSDNCCGIAREHLDKVFEPFFSTKPQGQGTGLGLCVVQAILSHVGGKVRVESELGKGTTFFVILPLNGNAHREQQGT